MNQTKKIKKNKENFNIQMPLILSMIVICALIVLTIMFLPLINSIFSKKSFLNSFTSLLPITNNLGGTIGGLLGPIVALLAALLTYWAFMEQVKANKKQAKQFKKQFRDQQNSKFESRFFELLKIHIENRDRFNNLFPKNDGFAEILKELKFLHNIFEITYEQENINFLNNEKFIKYRHSSSMNELDSYIKEIINLIKIILLDPESRNLIINNDNKSFISALEKLIYEERDFGFPENSLISKKSKCLYLKYNDLKDKEKIEQVSLIIDSNPHALKGYLIILSPYLSTLRLLFSFINEDKFLRGKNKRPYFDIIRSTFTIDELCFLYFYFVSGFDPLFSKVDILDASLFYELDKRKVDSIIDYCRVENYFEHIYQDFIYENNNKIGIKDFFRDITKFKT
ncbi:putative phage abortive infection protein [Arcicella rigui]|uniref:Phage abortive infection protein n=1 Tax=Arcicella rigui TaxID=797020 RepID=A0ABU5QCS6_9BACT|nr:putative phage abortive infection protein [Arcicella rigui]MEA5140636.1 putative phage abortive infection protein [Arcicella rigui]